MKVADSISRRVTLRELRLFLAVAKAGSLLKAAHEIGLSQPALSRCIADLEDTFGVRLLDRTNRGVVATPHGMVLLRRATSVFDELRQAASELESLSGAGGGELRVGGTPTMCAALLPCVIRAFRARRRGIQFHVMELESAKLASEVVGRVLDLALGREHVVSHDHGLTFEPLFEDRLFVVAGPRHPLASRRSVSFEEATRHEWVLPAADSGVMAHFNVELRRQKLDLVSPAVTTMSMLVRRELIATSSFLTVMYGSVLRFGSAPKSFRVLPIDLPGGVPIGFAFLKDRTLAPSAAAFVQTIKEWVKPLHSLSAAYFLRNGS